MMEPFRNEPFTDFTDGDNKKSFRAALDQVTRQLGQEYAVIISGERILTGRKSASINPARISQVIGEVYQADKPLADKAVSRAAEAYASWSRVKPGQRARYLYKTAALLRQRKYEFSAWMVLESGKSWQEADADTAEAIDFLEFYGREMERLGSRQPLTRIPGEDNELTYIPLGVGIVIPPWNFPLAITVGMTMAAVAAGNTVVLKPASPTPVIAAKFVELLDEAGLPDGVVNYLPGAGGEIGDTLVDHPLARFVSFTGSREIGLRINERAARASRARSGSNGSSRRWAARMPLSWTAAATWSLQPRQSPLPLSASPAKNVPLARAQLFILLCITRCCTKLCRALRLCVSAIPQIQRASPGP